jgi:hypothetical protein
MNSPNFERAFGDECKFQLLSSISFTRLLLAAFLLNVSSVEAETWTNFGVTGEVSLCVVNGSTSRVVTNITYPFTAEVLSTGWNIDVVFPQSEIEAGCDGASVYSVQKSSNSPDEHGLVSTGKYPLAEEWWITLPWLAYCSESYFNEKTNLPAPWLNATVFPLASIFSTSITRLESNPKVPDSMKFTMGGRKSAEEIRKLAWVNSSHLTEGEMKKLDLYQEGFVGGEYSINAVTNVAGMVLPLEFALKVYNLPPNSIYKVYRGKLTSVFANRRTTPVPEITKRMGVVDYRFKDTDHNVDSISYNILTPFHWMPENSPELKAKFDKQVEETRSLNAYKSH